MASTKTFARAETRPQDGPPPNPHGAALLPPEQRHSEEERDDDEQPEEQVEAGRWWRRRSRAVARGRIRRWTAAVEPPIPAKHQHREQGNEIRSLAEVVAAHVRRLARQPRPLRTGTEGTDRAERLHSWRAA